MGTVVAGGDGPRVVRARLSRAGAVSLGRAARHLRRAAERLRRPTRCNTARRADTRRCSRRSSDSRRSVESRAARDELLITSGSQQGIDLIARVLVSPGDVVLVELPTFTGGIAAFRNAQADLVGVPQDADGISLDALDAGVAARARRRQDGQAAVRHPELPESDRDAARSRQAPAAGRVGRAARRADRRGRPVRLVCTSRTSRPRRKRGRCARTIRKDGCST